MCHNKLEFLSHHGKLNKIKWKSQSRKIVWIFVDSSGYIIAIVISFLWSLASISLKSRGLVSILTIQSTICSSSNFGSDIVDKV